MHPPYHLRPNKAVDRFAFLDAIRKLDRIERLSGYTYYGFGGPYLEEFRLLYEFCPGMKMVSIEEDEETVKRQKFHLPCGTVHLENLDFNSFLITYQPKKERGVFWLDYTNLEYSNFTEFGALLAKLPENSMVKLSVKCQPKDYYESPQSFKDRFGSLMPDQTISIPRLMPEFATLLQDMAQITAQRALPGSSGFRFQPVSSFFYSDTVGMFTVTGIICKRGDRGREVRKAYEDWEFANLNWARPRQINVPTLSTKERLFLQSHLPSKKAKDFGKLLGYSVANGTESNAKLMKQYAIFHRYFPHFMKVVP